MENKIDDKLDKLLGDLEKVIKTPHNNKPKNKQAKPVRNREQNIKQNKNYNNRYMKDNKQNINRNKHHNKQQNNKEQNNRQVKQQNRYSNPQNKYINRNKKEVSTEGKIKAPKKNVLRIITLGGVEEVGKNCTVLEYNNDIVVIDMGLQFPPDNFHGIQYIIPDYSYLEKNKNKIRGILITHAHLDHIGAIPYILKDLDKKIPIYGSNMTCKIIEKRQEEFGYKLSLRTVRARDKIQLGSFSVDFCHVNHTIPGCLGVAVTSKVGTIVNLGDWKIDYKPIGDKQADLKHIAEIGKKGVLAVLGDSTNAYMEGHQISETDVMNTLDQIFQTSKERIIIGTFASSLSRLQQIIWLSEKYNKKVFFAGYSMKNNVKIAKELKYLKYNNNTLITEKQLKKLPDNQTVIACTGSQGEENAALNKIAEDKHPAIQISPKDIFVFSSSVIPGNEQSIQTLLDKIYRKGAKVINVKELAVHAGGHAKSEEVKLMYSLLNPQYYIPVHGSHYLLAKHKELIESLDHNKEKIILPDNGSIFDFHLNGHLERQKSKVSNNIIAIDGFKLGGVSNMVLKDRQLMANNGIFTIILTVNTQTKKLLNSPDIISRGFIHLKTSEDLLNKARYLAKEVFYEQKNLIPKKTLELKNILRNKISRFLYKRTGREPIVLPVIINV